MAAFEIGDRVRVDIPDETDPDFEWHGKHGIVVEVLEDDADELTGDAADGRIYRIDLENAETQLDLRQQDLRAPFVE